MKVIPEETLRAH